MGASSPVGDISGSISFSKSMPKLDHVLDSWVAFRIAWILCVDYGGDWVAWNMAKSRFLETASETKMYMTGEQAFKHTLLTMIYDYGLIEADEYPIDPLAWQKCIEERKEQAKKDKRIRKSPEEYCRNKIRRVVNIRATPRLCELLLEAINKKSERERIPIRLPIRVLKMLRTVIEREVSQDNALTSPEVISIEA